MLESPAHYIVLMLLAGIVMGTVFDIYNTVTSAANWLRILRSILDVAFFVTSSLVVYNISLMTDNGRFRLYTFGLLIIGYAVYWMFFHHAIVTSAHLIIKIIRSVFMMLWRLVFTLVIHPVLWILRILQAVFRGMYRIGCRIENILCWCISVIARIVLFPLRGYTSILSRIYVKVQPYQEGIWLQLSNWLRRPPSGA